MTVEHGAAPVQILPSRGCLIFGPAMIWPGRWPTAAPWLRDGDAVVVTSKVVSRARGRLVPAPEDPGGAGRAAPQG